MRKTLASFLGMTFSLSCAGAGSSTDGGGTATVAIADETFTVSNVLLSLETGEDAYFKIYGDDGANPDADCLPGLAGGLALTGDLPSGVTSLADLAGKELPFDFSGDGDDANLCFVGSNGLLGVERGTVRFTSVDGDNVAFSFDGTFSIYDGEGGRPATGVRASGSGVARAETN